MSKYTFNMKMLLDGKVDARRAKLVTFVDFCEENNIDFVPDVEKTIKENLDALTEFVKANHVQEETGIYSVEINEVTETVAEGFQEAQEADEKPVQKTGYLERRAHIIAEEMKQNNGLAPSKEAYGPEAPEYLRRRAGK